MNNVCVTSSELVCASYDNIYVSINVLPEAVCCCLQFIVIFMLMNNVCVQSFNFIRASTCASYDHIYVPIILLPEAVCCCLKHVILL